LSRADRDHIISWHNVNVALFELLTFGPVLVLAIAVKKSVVPEPLANVEIADR
jgi:hypothetical protein